MIRSIEPAMERGINRLFWPHDEQGVAVEPVVPKNQPSARRVDDRRVISRVVHVLKIDYRWIEFPNEYSLHTTVYSRFNRWSRQRFWTGMLEALPATGAVVRRVPT